MTSLTQKPEWKDLLDHKETLLPLKEMNNDFMLSLNGIHLDYSKNTASQETLNKLISLANSCDLEGWKDKMFSGEKINNTEDRAVLHTALRASKDKSIIVDGENIIPFVHETLVRMKNISDKIRQNKQITDIVNIGIGGSDLGPRMVCDALNHLEDGPKTHFVSNLDGTHTFKTLKKLKPESTMFLIASKSFGTQETMVNAQTAREWFLKTMSENDIKDHFIALSTNTEKVTTFGISEENMLPFCDWVGGRFSLWSPIGLSICISIGFDNFEKLLNGAHTMDTHFKTAPLDQNMPVIMGMLGIWYRNFWNTTAQAILPYAEVLQHFPAFLQQMDMESNGKSVTRDGQKTDYKTGSIVFGMAGTNGQHAFYQLIHQGTDTIPCDFILVKNQENTNDNHQKKLLANGLAQADALMLGQIHDNPHHNFNGNIPSNTIVLDDLSPFNLGQLIALYEHKIFVQGIIWNLNSFDQPGVELGKTLANEIINGGAKTKLHKFVLD